MDVNKNEFLLPNMIKGKVDTNNQEIFRYSITTSDVLIARTSETIKEIAYSSCLLENIANCTYSGFLLKASPKIKNIIFPPYIVLLLRSQIYRKRLMKLSTETSRALINSDNLAKLIIIIPKFEEQKKIWLFFNLLLKKITITEQKIETLKKYKEGLDQTAFTEGSTIKLGSLIEQLNIRNKSLKKIHIFSISNQFGFIPQEDIFLGKTISLKNKKNYKIVEKYQFAYNPARINVGSIACQTYDIGQVSPMYIVFKTERNNVEILNEWFHSRFFIKEINSNLEGSVRKILTFESLSNLLIKWPKDGLIYSRAFTKVNLKINLLLQQLNDLKMLKKYLLNKLFV